MLYLPWRCEETDIIEVNCELIYSDNIDIIRKICPLRGHILIARKFERA